MGFYLRKLEIAEETELNQLLDKEKEKLKEEFDRNILQVEAACRKRIFDMKQKHNNSRQKIQVISHRGLSTTPPPQQKI